MTAFIRRTLTNVLWAALIPSFACAFASIFVILSGGLWREFLAELISRMGGVWAAVVAMAIGLFAVLQLRENHPWYFKGMAEWSLLAGWDGRSPIPGIAHRLHWTEIAGVSSLASVAIVVGWNAVLLALACWISVRALSLVRGLLLHDERRAVLACVFLMIGAILFATWPVVSLVCLAALLFVMEQANARALARWASSQSDIDVDSVSVLTLEITPPLRSQIYPWSGLSPSIADPRPTARDACVYALAMGLFAAAVMIQVGNFVQRNPEISMSQEECVDGIGRLLAVTPLLIISLLRVMWFHANGWSSPLGIFDRIRTLRLIIPSHDYYIPAIAGPPALMFAVFLIPGATSPLRLGLLCGFGALVLLRLGPNPAHWFATSNSRLLRWVPPASARPVPK